jgi:nitrite reductase/ring-hydroxylating ferredoxin subunit
VAQPGVHAQVCALLGYDPDAEPPARPTVADALARSAPGQLAAAERDGEPVAVAVLADGRAFLLPDRCPHDGGLLSDGFVDGDVIVCARHGWEFDPCTGRCPGRRGVTLAALPLPHRGPIRKPVDS